MTLPELLQSYHPFDDHETRMAARLSRFLQNEGDHFGRELVGSDPEWGHVTGSAWIVSPDFSQTVLVFHRKLGKWVQPGGHCESESDVLNVAMREAQEETGLDVKPIQTGVFDVDVHDIPEYWNTPAHLHFDVRFLLSAEATQAPVLSDESHAVRWFSLDEAESISDEASLKRMVEKTRALQASKI